MNRQKKNNMMKPDKWKRRYWTAAGAAVLCLCCTTSALAAGTDPLSIVNNLSDFIFSIIICTVSDHILTGEATTAEERQNSFTEMMELALKTAKALD